MSIPSQDSRQEAQYPTRVPLSGALPQLHTYFIQARQTMRCMYIADHPINGYLGSKGGRGAFSAESGTAAAPPPGQSARPRAPARELPAPNPPEDGIRCQLAVESRLSTRRNFCCNECSTNVFRRMLDVFAECRSRRQIAWVVV